METEKIEVKSAEIGLVIIQSNNEDKRSQYSVKKEETHCWKK